MGFLNPSQDEDARIDAMPGTTEVPPTGALDGLLSAIPKGITSGAVKVGQLGNDLASTDTGYAFFNSPSPDELLAHMQSPEPNSRAYDQLKAGVKVAADWAATGQDPRVTGSVGRIAAGTAEGLTIGLGGAEVAGPWGAAALLGGAEGHSSYKEAKAQGVDDTTALEQGAITGAFSAASAFLPMKFGKTLAQSVLGGAAANVTLGAAQRGLTSEVLAAHGYHEMADQYRVFDGEAIAADLILGGAFGAYGHATARKVNPADVDAAAAVAAEDHFNRSAPGVPTDPATATAHADTMAGALRSLADGDLPDIPPERAQQLVDNVLPDPAQSLAAPTPPEYQYVETRGVERFHGTSRVMPGDMPNNDYAMSGDNRNIFGQGFYTTDAADVAHGYMSKGRGNEPALYRVKERPGVKLYDMESPLTPDIKSLAGDVFGDLTPTETIDGRPITNLRDMYNEFRAESQNNGLSRDDVQGYFDSFRYELEKMGYNGFRHIGSADGGKYQPHDVRIYWTPENNIDVSRASISDFRKIKTHEKPSPLQEAAQAELPGFEAAAADVPRMELPPEEVPPPKPEPAPAPAGEPAKEPDVPLDDFHGEMLDHLVHNYPDETYTTEDGREVTYRQMANEMQAQRNEADAFSKLHDVAAACAARNGV